MRRMRILCKTIISITAICAGLFLTNNAHAFSFSPSNSLWSAIADRHQLSAESSHYYVKRELKWYSHNPRYVERLSKNAYPYLYYVYKQTKKNHLPAELALLPMLESNYRPFTYSHVGAVGLWQLMPGTAAGQGIHMNWWYDGRRDTIDATKVALSYLSYLHQFFHGDWLLAIAAYDAGEGTVLNAIRYNQKRNLPTDFWELKLPKETRIYVPRLLALANIIEHPSSYHVHLNPIPNAPIVDTVTIHNQMNLSSIAKAANMTLKQVHELNPGFRRFATPPKQSARLILPISNIPHFLKQAKTYAKASTEWVHYTVQPGDTLGKIANHFKTSVAAIKQANGMHNNVIRVYHPILIPKASKTISGQPIKNAIAKQLINEDHIPGPKHLTYTVKPGDSLWTIAKKFGVKIVQLRYWNKLAKNAVLKNNQQLVIWKSNHHLYLPGFHHYTVKSGDTLSVIAEKNHTSVQSIKSANHLKSDALHISQQLIIPNRG